MYYDQAISRTRELIYTMQADGSRKFLLKILGLDLTRLRRDLPGLRQLILGFSSVDIVLGLVAGSESANALPNGSGAANLVQIRQSLSDMLDEQSLRGRIVGLKTIPAVNGWAIGTPLTALHYFIARTVNHGGEVQDVGPDGYREIALPERYSHDRALISEFEGAIKSGVRLPLLPTGQQQELPCSTVGSLSFIDAGEPRRSEGSHAQTPSLASAEKEILEALGAQTLISKHIAPLAGYHPDTTRKHLANLIRRGLVENIRGKGYRRCYPV